MRPMSNPVADGSSARHLGNARVPGSHRVRDDPVTCNSVAVGRLRAFNVYRTRLLAYSAGA